MEKRIDFQKSYVTEASPIIEIDRFEVKTGKPVDYFIVHPVMKKSLFGKEKVIGYAEAISGITVCNRIPLVDDMGFEINDFLRDATTDKQRIGDTHWRVNLEAQADELVTEEVLQEYYKQTKDQILIKLVEARTKCQEAIKVDSLDKVFGKKKKETN